MKTIVIAVCAALALGGCASTDYKYYKDIQVEFAKAEAKKYEAMARIAEGGDTTAKVAAMFALQGNQSTQQHHVVAPKSSAETALQWAGIILPTAVQAYGIHANQQIAVTQSNNARLTAVSTNDAFVGMAGQIQAPQANITNTLSGTGVLGSGTYTTTANPVTTTTTTTDRHDTTDNHTVTNPPGGKTCSVNATGTLVCL